MDAATPTRRSLPRRGAGLALGALAALGLPWIIGAWVKTGLQPGLSDDAAREAMRVDFIVAGATLFGLSMVMVAAFGCWVVGVMQGPARHGDGFPGDAPGAPGAREPRP